MVQIVISKSNAINCTVRTIYQCYAITELLTTVVILQSKKHTLNWQYLASILSRRNPPTNPPCSTPQQPTVMYINISYTWYIASTHGAVEIHATQTTT